MTQHTWVELVDRRDDWLMPWFDLFETAFPNHEKILVSEFLRILRKKEQQEDTPEHLFAVIDEEQQLAGIVNYQLYPQTGLAYLWYFAVQAQKRNQGLGGRVYQELIGRLKQAGVKAMVMEVEIPENCATPDGQDYAARRIGFYRRHGALRLSGVDYLQEVGPHQPLTPMYLLIHLLRPTPVEELYAGITEVAGDNIIRTGPLTLI